MLEKQFEQFLLPYLNTPAKQVVVAYSGGLDSSCVLQLAAVIKERYPQHQWCALHVNHGISQQAKDWARHCRQTAESLGFLFLLAEHQIKPQSRQSLEKLARDARYQSFQELTKPDAVILLGQHQQDQTETFLLQLKRGSGLAGLSSMAAAKQKGTRLYLRPLLNTDKQQIVDYGVSNNLSWIEDPSNQDVSFDRNFLRHQVIPQLEKRWQGFGKAVARSAELCAEQQALLDEVAEQECLKLLDGEQTLDCEGLLALSTGKQKLVLRFWIGLHQHVMPSQSVLTEIQSVLKSREDSQAKVCWDGKQVRRYRSRLYLLNEWASSEQISVDWKDVQSTLCLPENLGEVALSDFGQVRAPTAEETVTIRFKASSANYKFAQRQHRISVNRYFKEKQVPPWMRSRTPMLYYNEQLIAVLNLGVVQEGG